jgi:hypothetical protein
VVKITDINKKTKTKKSDRAKIDEIMKYLFSVSKETLVTMLNSLFHENFAPEQVEIIQTNAEFDDFNFKIIRGDMFFRIDDKITDKLYHYHLEFQTYRDNLIGIRIFEYDFKKAVENNRLTNNNTDNDGEIVLYMPKSLVIHVEQNEKIPDDFYRIKIVFYDENNQEQIVDYKIPVVRYWEYDSQRLIDEKLYPLLPLQLFLLRAELEKMSRRKNPQDKQEIIEKIKVITDRIVREAHRLGDEGKITDEDIDKITTAIGELFKHLNYKYKVDEKLNEEVSNMIKSLYDENVFIKGKQEKAIEIAKKMLLKNISINEIHEFTGLMEENIKDIEKTL